MKKGPGCPHWTPRAKGINILMSDIQPLMLSILHLIDKTYKVLQGSNDFEALERGLQKAG
jgi:hypothetical protein